MIINRRIYIKILLMSVVILIGICYGSKAQAENSGSETAYRELLEGRRMLHIDEDMLKILKELGRQGDFECGAFSMKEILEKINADYYEHYDENNRIAGVEYAYLDCGKDGSRELAVRFDARSSDMFQLTFIIIYENGTLYLRHAFESWSRNSVLLNQYGYIWESGSNGATSGAGNESFVDSSGRAKIILDKRMDWSDIDEPEICQQVYGTEEYFFCNVRFQIQDKEYECLLNKDGEDPDDEDFALFKKLYEEKYGKIYTKAEIEKILEKLRKKIGITKEMMEKTAPDWESLQTAAFKDQVREIDLKETRKKAQKENTSIVKKGWKTCGKDSSRIIILKEGYLNYNGGQAIKYALGDYFNEKNISDTEWNLLQTISYGDMLHAVTVQNEEGRIICLMLCSDAAVLGLPEYTEYLLVADCHLDKVGVTIDHSALDWNSYDTQAKQTYSVERPDKLCNYYYANMALNQYLTEQDADPSMEWELDSNAVCRMDYRKIIVRFISGEQEIVMAIDADYDRYSVIIQKGLVKESNGEKETDPMKDHIASEKEACAYLEQQVPEFKAMAEYIKTHSDGKSHFCIRYPGESDLINRIGLSDYYFGYYYAFYVGESNESHTTNWYWFYVKEDLSEVLWDDVVGLELCSLEEWRSSEQYLNNELYNQYH